MRTLRLLTWGCLVVPCSSAQAAGRAENVFGSVLVDGRKAAQIHYTIQYGEDGDLETVPTRVSRSIVGVRVFNFEQSLHEEWRRGRLHEMRSRTDDDGRINAAMLDRGSEFFKGVLNGKPVELPERAFPASVWHCAITQQSLLFGLAALKLMQVRISRASETVAIQGKTVAAERFDFSGDWQATVWFDPNRRLVKFQYVTDGHVVVVQLDE